MKCAAVVAFLSLLSLGRSAPVSSCDSLLRPIAISNEGMLGKWLYIGGSSDIPGSRSLGYLLTSVWLDITATTQSNILNIVQVQRVAGDCSSFTYNVTFENSTMLIERPFYLKEVYLPTDCTDCLVVLEEVSSGKSTFTSLMLFSKSETVSADIVEMLKKQAECLRMPSPIMMDPSEEMCPDSTPTTDGLDAIYFLLESKMQHRIARLLDSLFDLFVN